MDKPEMDINQLKALIDQHVRLSHDGQDIKLYVEIDRGNFIVHFELPSTYDGVNDAPTSDRANLEALGIVGRNQLQVLSEEFGYGYPILFASLIRNLQSKNHRLSIAALECYGMNTTVYIPLVNAEGKSISEDLWALYDELNLIRRHLSDFDQGKAIA